MQTVPKFVAAATPALLSRDAAREVIAARLAQLDHAPDFLDNQAVAALTEYAAGSPQRLRAALASTLFLASTEDAPQVGRALVQRALQDSDTRPVSQQRTAPTRSWPLAGAAAAAGLAVLVAVAVLPYRSPPPTPTTVPAPGAPSSRPAAPRTASPRPAEPIAAPPPTLPPVVVQRPTVPQPLVEQRVAAPVVPPDILPASPQATVVLMYSTHNAAALSRLDQLVRRLRQAGIGQIETRAVAFTSAARRPVSYFFADDYEPAQTISTVLQGEGWPRLQRNSLPPRLVLPPTGVPPRHPGLIEVRLP